MPITADQVARAFYAPRPYVPSAGLSLAQGLASGAQTGMQLYSQAQQMKAQQMQQQALAAQQQQQQQAAQQQAAAMRVQGAFQVNNQMLQGVRPDMTNQEIQMQVQNNLKGISPDFLAQYGLSPDDLQDDINRLQSNPQEFLSVIGSEQQQLAQALSPPKPPEELTLKDRNSLRKGFRQEFIARTGKQIDETKALYDQVMESPNTGTGDIARIKSVIAMVEKGIATDDEFNAMARAAGIESGLDGLKAYVLGQGTLGTTSRQQIRDLAESIFINRLRDAKSVADHIAVDAKTYGIDKGTVPSEYATMFKKYGEKMANTEATYSSSTDNQGASVVKHFETVKDLL